MKAEAQDILCDPTDGSWKLSDDGKDIWIHYRRCPHCDKPAPMVMCEYEAIAVADTATGYVSAEFYECKCGAQWRVE